MTAPVIILERARIAAAALDAYHTALERASAEVGTSHHLARNLLATERKRATESLHGFAIILGSPEERSLVREIAEAVTGGYSKAGWTLRIKRIAAAATNTPATPEPGDAA